jgi:hypothetical protein
MITAVTQWISGNLKNTERVEPATYGLRTHPQKPNLFELLGVEFEDATMQGLWKWYADALRKKSGGLSDEEILVRFVNYMNSDKGKEMYADQKKLDEELQGLAPSIK